MSDDKRDSASEQANRGQDCYRVYVAPWASDRDQGERSKARNLPRPRRGRPFANRRKSARGRGPGDAVQPLDGDVLKDPRAEQASRFRGNNRP